MDEILAFVPQYVILQNDMITNVKRQCHRSFLHYEFPKGRTIPCT